MTDLPADEPTEADPLPEDLPEDLYVDIESTIHQHCGHDGQSDEANDWVTDLMSAISPLIVRALVGGRSAPETVGGYESSGRPATDLAPPPRGPAPGGGRSAAPTREAALFQLGEFTAHSGSRLPWKIDCDALTPADWECLAAMAVEVLPPFGGVEGVPRGGMRFADALRGHCTDGCDTLLIADDVCTTGASLEEWRLGREAIGVVAFARGPVPSWVVALLSRSAVEPPAGVEELRSRLVEIYRAVDHQMAVVGDVADSLPDQPDLRKALWRVQSEVSQAIELLPSELPLLRVAAEPNEEATDDGSPEPPEAE